MDEVGFILNGYSNREQFGYTYVDLEDVGQIKKSFL